jgi:hypothetical protein
MQRIISYVLLVNSMLVNSHAQNFVSVIHHCSTPISNDGYIKLSTYTPIEVYSYLWSTGDTSQSISGLSPGLYSVSISSEAACMEFIEFNIGDCSILNESDYENLSLTFTTSGNPSNNEGQIEVQAQEGSGIYYYNWSGPQGEFSSGPVVWDLGVGLYCVTVSDGCSDYQDCIELLANYQEISDRKNDIKEEGENRYHFYPNPFSSTVNVTARIFREGDGSIIIRDGIGRELFKTNLYWKKGTNQYSLVLPMIKNEGFYIAECYLNGKLENASKLNKN